MSFFTLAVLTALCLALAPLRGYAVIGAALLLYLYPLLTLGIVLAAGITFVYWHWRIKP